ncbi:hypothetical protein M472_07865 [Sphingobacterium paucimobilis HER1398]|uniref:Uncharacterized protein n=1 Tax=Sphingobacterium paucimobilis HER1398 TaxID=1346330 RepID=U2J7Q2_9SPHI|nr:hypothetical protein M472_07865 [Sphingobacterium paucimobilis HER1398]
MDQLGQSIHRAAQTINQLKQSIQRTAQKKDQKWLISGILINKKPLVNG